MRYIYILQSIEAPERFYTGPDGAASNRVRRVQSASARATSSKPVAVKMKIFFMPPAA